jgi:hypothetical protein
VIFFISKSGSTHGRRLNRCYLLSKNEVKVPLKRERLGLQLYITSLRPNTFGIVPIQPVLAAYKSKVDQDERPYKMVSL